MSMHLPNADLALVQSVLAAAALPAGTEVLLFGSRVHGRNLKRFSDLDLCLRNDDLPIEAATLARLRDAFDDSNLPYRVDLVVWSEIAPEFQAAIADDLTWVFSAPTEDELPWKLTPAKP